MRRRTNRQVRSGSLGSNSDIESVNEEKSQPQSNSPPAPPPSSSSLSLHTVAPPGRSPASHPAPPVPAPLPAPMSSSPSPADSTHYRVKAEKILDHLFDEDESRDTWVNA